MDGCKLAIICDEPDESLRPITGRVLVTTEADLRCEELVVFLQRAASGRHVDRVELYDKIELISGDSDDSGDSENWRSGENYEYEFELPAQDFGGSFESDGFQFGWRLLARAKFPGGRQVEAKRELEQVVPAGAGMEVWTAVPARPGASDGSMKGCVPVMMLLILAAGLIIWLGLRWDNDILVGFAGIFAVMFCGVFVLLTRELAKEEKVGQPQVHCENVEVSGYREETAERLACTVWLQEKVRVRRVSFELRVFWKEYRYDGVKRRPPESREVILFQEESAAQREEPGKWCGELPLPASGSAPFSQTLSEGDWSNSKNKIGACWELRAHITVAGDHITETRTLVARPSEDRLGTG